MGHDWEDSFEDFVRRASPGLLRTATLLTGDAGAAEDLVQVALVRVARRFKPEEPTPTAYARRILVNLVKDRHRARSRRPAEVYADAVADAWVASDSTDGVVDRQHLMEAVRELPLRQRTVP